MDAGSPSEKSSHSDAGANEERDPKRQRTESAGKGESTSGAKNLLKRIAFKGYDEREKAAYNVNVLTFQQDGSRPITALDDILRALLFACQLIEDDANKQRDKGTTSSSIAGKENKNKEKNSKPGLELSRVVWGLEWTGQCDVWPGLMC